MNKALAMQTRGPSLDPQHPHKPVCNLKCGGEGQKNPRACGPCSGANCELQVQSDTLSKIRWRVID